MRNPSTVHKFALAAVASTMLLSACVDSDPQSGATPPEEPTASAETVEPSDAAPETQESQPPQPSSTRQPVDAGPLDGAELNEAGVAWFGAFCSGIGELSKFGVPDTEELEVAETADAVGTTYGNFGTGFEAAAEQLTGLDSDMNFENADAFANEAIESIGEVGSVYNTGAETLQSGSYSTEEELLVDVRQIETEAVEAGAGDFGLSSLDESVFDAVNAQVPACANP